MELALLWGALTLVAAVLGIVGWRRGRATVVLGGARAWVPHSPWPDFCVCYQHISLALPQSF